MLGCEMNINLVYLSQTGNTRKVTEAMAGAFGKAGHTVEVVPLNKASPQNVTGADFLGIATPCFFSQAPTPVKKFLSGLPALNGQQSFVVATSGGGPGRVLYDMTCLLRSRGAFVAGGFLSRGEVHYPAKCIDGRFPGRPNDSDLAEAAQFAKAIAEHISAGNPGTPTVSRKDALKAGLGFYDIVGLTIKDSLIRLFMPEPKLDPSQCNQCQQCAVECPVGNITLQPYPVLGNQCIRCYRCYMICPQKAFKMNTGLVNLIVKSIYSVTFERWFGDVKPGEEMYRPDADTAT
jgi:flavodoxin/Pyruvate/2-oxoacid:ferredoxin oxidoreductase delta subunit